MPTSLAKRVIFLYEYFQLPETSQECLAGKSPSVQVSGRRTPIPSVSWRPRTPSFPPIPLKNHCNDFFRIPMMGIVVFDSKAMCLNVYFSKKRDLIGIPFSNSLAAMFSKDIEEITLVHLSPPGIHSHLSRLNRFPFHFP